MVSGKINAKKNIEIKQKIANIQNAYSSPIKVLIFVKNFVRMKPNIQHQPVVKAEALDLTLDGNNSPMIAQGKDP